MVEKKEKEYNWRDDPEVREFKLIIKAILITALIMVILSTLPSFYALFVRGNPKMSAVNDIEYSFSNDDYFDSDSLDYVNDGNMNWRYKRTYSTELIGTFTFDNDVLGSYPLEWDITEGSGCIGEVISGIGGHNKVLRLSDGHLANTVQAQQNFNWSIERGFIEFFYRQTSNSKQSIFYLLDDTTIVVEIHFYNNGYIRYYDGTFHNIIPYQPNKWYHIRLEFECNSLGKFYDLTADTFNIQINGVKYGAYSFRNSVNSISSLSFITSTLYTSYIVYINDIGYGWDKDNWDFSDLNPYEITNPLFANYSSWNHEYESNAKGTVRTTNPIDGNYVEINDHDNYQDCSIEVQFQPQVSGIISYWIRTSINTEEYFFVLYEGSTALTYIVLGNELYIGGGIGWFYTDPITSWTGITNNSRQNGVWKFVELGFNATSDTFSLSLDNISYGSFPFITNADNNITSLIFKTTQGNTAFSGAFDSIQFSWNENNYFDFGNLILTYTEDTDIIEVDKYEFHLEDVKDRADSGDDNFLNWIDIETGSGGSDTVNIQDDPLSISTDNIIDIETPPIAGQIRGIYKDFSINANESIGVSLTYELQTFDDPNGYLSFIGQSDDLSDIFEIRITGNLDIQYYDGSTYIDLTITTTNERYQLYVYVDYIRNICIIYYSSVFFIIPVITEDKEGLGYVEITSHTYTSGKYCSVEIDNVGIYGQHGISLTSEIAYRQINLGFTDNYWSFGKHSIFENDITSGNEIQLSLTVLGLEYFPYYPYNDLFSMFAISDFNLYNYTHWNRRNLGVGDLKYQGSRYLPRIIIHWKYNMTPLTEIKIFGTKLVQGTNEYFLEYSYSGVNPQESYFYSSGGNLYFTIFSDKSELEFISAVFDIDNQPTNNYTILWGGKKNFAEIFAELRVNFLDTTYSSYLLTSFYQRKRDYMGFEKTASTIEFIISDNDRDIDGQFSGYLAAFTFIWNPSLILDVAIGEYLAILAPILVIFIITLSIWQMSRKKSKTMLVAPSIVLMSGMCFIADLIPLWILFIMIVCSGILIYSKFKNFFMMFSSFGTMATAFLVYGTIIDLWVFYVFFLLMISYTIFIGVGDIKGGRE